MKPWLLDMALAPLDGMGLSHLRRDLVSGLAGDVLEVGAGTGRNLPYYAPPLTLTLTDPDRDLLGRAEERTADAKVPVHVVPAAAESLPFPDHRFDAVVATLAFCTIADPQGALREIRRVLKPTGSLRLLEHVRHGNRTVARLQDALDPLWSKVAGGCHLNRSTETEVQSAGFRIIPLRGFRSVIRKGAYLGGLLLFLWAEPLDPLPIHAPEPSERETIGKE